MGRKTLYDTIYLTSAQKHHLGRKVKQARLKANLSVEMLADKLNMSTESLIRLENGDFELYDDFVHTLQ